ncbi:MAG TPA: diguanylate cyclase [Acidimicrobiales bacterium]|nr:diguanylate cyclase [Acidimicrobiales bacterium]
MSAGHDLGDEALRARLEDLQARHDELEARHRQLETRLGEVTRASSEFRRALTRLGDALADAHNLPGMVSAVLETSVLYLGAEAGVVYEIVPGSDRLRAISTFGAVGDLGDLVRGEGVAGAAAATDEVVVWPGPDVGGPTPGEPAAAGAAAVAAPVRADGHIFRVLALYGLPGGQPPSADDVETLQTLVRQAETAIDNSFLYEEAKRLSLSDGLTGLGNSRNFSLRLSEELSRSVRFGEPFSLVFCDLDGFKGINDTYGHQVGNGVLVEVARRLTESTREVDLLTRLGEGADEFALLLPRTGLAGALLVAEKVRATVTDEPFAIDELRLPITMSLGVASYPEHGTSEKELKAAADAALYRAKHEGGNRVEQATFGEDPVTRRPGPSALGQRGATS